MAACSEEEERDGQLRKGVHAGIQRAGSLQLPQKSGFV